MSGRNRNKSFVSMKNALMMMTIGMLTLITMIVLSLLSARPPAEASPSPYKGHIVIDKSNGDTNQHQHIKIGKRWAVMMIGSARSYAFSRSSFIENVLHQTDPPMDVFTSTILMNNSSCFIEKHSQELLVKDSTAVRFHQLNDEVKKRSDKQKTQDRFVNEQSALLQLIEDYSKEHNITYDYIFYTRPDLYYTMPFNITEVERSLEVRMSTLFSPECCKFRGGWCDRLAAASYQDFSKMIVSSEDWARSGGDKYAYEAAFRHRAEYANLTNFDLTLKKDYGFVTLRLGHAAQSCNGGAILKSHWTDKLCNKNMTFPDLETTPDSCRLLNSTNPDSCSRWG